MPDLPSLNALRAFEAAARRGSVKLAAAELYVTPGAVSQQIKALEETLGTPLFRRRPSGMQLTEPGAALYPVLSTAFQSIADALLRLQRREREGPLTVSVVPSFAARWLVPRLGRLRERHPALDVRIHASTQLADFTRGDVDVAIRLGGGAYPGLLTDFLFRTPQFPVCSPGLLKGPHPLRKPDDLRFHTLLHDEHYVEWEAWLALHKVPGVNARRGTVFSDASMALQAAVDGQGVALSRRELVVQELAAGRLVQPFDLSLPREGAYYLVMPPAMADWPKVAAFREWLLDEAQRDRALVGDPAAPPGPQADASAPPATRRKSAARAPSRGAGRRRA